MGKVCVTIYAGDAPLLHALNSKGWQPQPPCPDSHSLSVEPTRLAKYAANGVVQRNVGHRVQGHHPGTKKVKIKTGVVRLFAF